MARCNSAAIAANSVAMTPPDRIRRGLAWAGLIAAWPLPNLAKEAPAMTTVATGRFTVQMTPQGEGQSADGVSLGRLTLAKRFEGDLQGEGLGEMLTALTPVKGSAGYVAIERVTGSLHGRSGSFVFQHSGTMDQGAQRLSITVVPGSGTGALAGLSGDFRLRVEGGVHHYEFSYRLSADAPADASSGAAR